MRRRPRPEAATPQPRLNLGPQGKAGAGVDLAQGLLTGPLGQGQAADPCGFRAGAVDLLQGREGLGMLLDFTDTFTMAMVPGPTLGDEPPATILHET